jgi:hypothetical protein
MRLVKRTSLTGRSYQPRLRIDGPCLDDVDVASWPVQTMPKTDDEAAYAVELDGLSRESI